MCLHNNMAYKTPPRLRDSHRDSAVACLDVGASVSDVTSHHIVGEILLLYQLRGVHRDLGWK